MSSSTGVVRKVAIAGSGVAALAAAIQLAKAEVEVDVYESMPELSALGSGITLQGNALRVFDQLGVWERVRSQGFPFQGLNLRAPGPGAPVVAQLPDVQTGGPKYPAAMGMYRPDLAAIMLSRAQEVGARVHFSSKVTGLNDTGDAVEVFVNDASVGHFDLLVGADGLNSTVRDLIGIETKPQPTGMGIWRTVVRRPEEVERTELYYGGPVYIAGYTPTAEDSMYAFLVEKAQDRSHLDSKERIQIMLEESEAYQGPWNSIRESLEGAGYPVNYTWFTSHLVEEPWNRGRTVIIGDAAHSCPPTIAQGAAQSVEDALVLVELLTSGAGLNDGLWKEFHDRRLPRARTVVEASVQLGQWQIEGNREADPGALIFEVAQKMAEPV